MERKDLSIRQDLYPDPLSSSTFQRWMEDPLKAPLDAQKKARTLLRNAGDPRLWIQDLPRSGDIPFAHPLPLRKLQGYSLPSPLPDRLKAGITLLLDGLFTAQQRVSSITERISPETRSLFERYLYPSFFHEGRPEGRPEGTRWIEEWRKAIRFVEGFDRKGLVEAAMTLIEALQAAVLLFQEGAEENQGIRSFSFQTPLGQVRIGGMGSDVHEGPAVLILDLGGNDLYRGRVASGNGGCSIVLDLDGDDVYLGEDFTQGVGHWGVGILFDLKGNDLYRAGDLSQGAGLFGLGLIFDREGSDIYIGGRFVQAASAFGLGGVIDLLGEDSYQCRHSGQAYSGTLGVSSLCDLRGNDRYLAGIGTPDPREPDRNKGLSQGFSMGMRNGAAGGFALLADGSGNDLYQCPYFGQGASYWMGVGILYDENGKDTYIARRYAQGAGIHFSFGLLMDVSGDDHTVSWGASQGCGYDYGIGILINMEGNDTYVSEWLSMGASDANGIGILIEGSGDDGYDVRDGLGTGRYAEDRRSGGVGLFIDASGRDRYSQRGAENSIWGSNRWGIGLDGEGAVGLDFLPPERAPSFPEEAERKRERERSELLKALDRSQGLPYPRNVEGILDVASHWGLEEGIPRIAAERLLEMDPEESVPTVVRLLSTPNTMSLLFMERFFRVHALHAVPHLIQKAKEADPVIRSRALYYLGQIQDPRAMVACVEALGSPFWGVRAMGIRAIGEIGSRQKGGDPKALCDLLSNALKDPDPTARMYAAYALGQVGCRDGIPELLALLKAPHPWIRDAAAASLSLFGEEALCPVDRAMKGEGSSFRIMALEVLSRIQGGEARALIERSLQDPDESVRRAAVRALSGSPPPSP